jgi:hypothetical protein
MTLKKFKYYSLVMILTAVSLFLLATPHQTLAHTRVEVGDYVLIVGWQEEPVIVGERNAIVVEVHRLVANSDNEAPVDGVESTLDLELIYAGNKFRANINPTERAGVYTAEVYPTVRGQYTVRLFGSIEGTEIDETLNPEEVSSASRLQFPEAEPDPFTLQSRIDALEAELRMSRLFAYAGVLIGLVGTILGAVGIRKKTI